MRTRSPTSRNKDAKEDSEIYVGNINAQTPVEPEDLKRLFSIAGQVNNVRIEKSNSKDTHFAFITFHTVDEAEQGCLYDGFKYHALSLKVQRKGRPGPPKLAQPPSEDFTQKLRELQERENTDLYLTNLNTADASEEVLHETFSAFGDVRRVHLHGDPSNPSRPAFITFSRPEQVQRAVDAMDGKEFLGNTLGVCKARVGQRFWAIEAASKASKDGKGEEKEKRGDGNRESASEKKEAKSKTSEVSSSTAKRPSTSSSTAKASTTAKSEPESKKRKEKDEKEEKKEKKEAEKTKATPPAKAISASTTATKASEKASAPAAASGSTAAAKKPAAASTATTTATAKTVPIKAPTAAAATNPPPAPPTLFPSPEQPSDPFNVVDSILTGLHGTRIADKEKNINLYCSTDTYGVPTMVLPLAGERVCNALHTVAQMIRREVDKLKEQAEEASTLRDQIKQLTASQTSLQEDNANVKRLMQESYDDLARLRSQNEQFSSLRLLNVASDLTGKEIANLCGRYGPVQHVAMLGSTAHVTFSQQVNVADIASQLSSQAANPQHAEACYHSATVVQDVAKQAPPAAAAPLPSQAPGVPVGTAPGAPVSAAPGPIGNGVATSPADGFLPVGQVGDGFSPMLASSSGLNPNASAYKGPPGGGPPGPGNRGAPGQQQQQQQQQQQAQAQAQQAAATQQPPPAAPAAAAAAAPAPAPAPAQPPAQQQAPPHGPPQHHPFSAPPTSHPPQYPQQPGPGPHPHSHGPPQHQHFQHPQAPGPHRPQHQLQQQQHLQQQQQQQQPPPQQPPPQQPLPSQQPPSQPAQQQAAPQTPVPHVCTVCGRTGLQVCSVCMLTYYCGSECQASHWPSHMNECEQLNKRR